MKDALLEIGVEHLPARFVDPALEQLAARARELLAEERLRCEAIETLGTLRRLAIILRGLADKSDALESAVTGPPARLLKDAEGRFTPQAEGFARNQGLKPSQLTVVTLPKGEFLQARKVVPGEPAARVLARLWPKLIFSLQFPKNMEWEASRLRFARPIRGLLALYGRQVTPFRLAGVRSSNKALGAGVGGRSIAIREAGEYAAKLKNHCILVRPEERRSALLKGLESALKRGAPSKSEDRETPPAKPDLSPDLVSEIVNLTEFPVPVPGSLDRKYLGLPRALLVTVLEKQLKFFPLLDAQRRLQAGFVGVRDGRSEGQREVADGFERVLEARLCDARFFHERDRKARLETRIEGLERVAYQRGLGSMADRTRRMEALALWTCGALKRRGAEFDQEAVERIVRLAHADLVTDVVREFPELQGVMGGHYALLDGEAERVARGLSEFYLPASAKGELPSDAEGNIAALVGKVDTLVATFAAGHRPSGSEDPFALRRAAMGIVRIVLERQLPLDLAAAVAESRRLVAADIQAQAAKGAKGEALEPGAESLDRDVLAFLWGRAEAAFLEMGYSAEESRSVAEGALSDLITAFRRLAAVHALRPDPDFATLAAAFKRAANILKQSPPDGAAVDPSLLRLEAETGLHQALVSAEAEVSASVAESDYQGALRQLVALKPAVDRFFDTVRVLDDDDAVRRNRLALLSRLVRLFKSIADISTI